MFTLLLTGLGTFAVGLMPTYDQIGIWAAVILVIVRLIQGFGVGGEQGGAALLTAEAAPPLKRGFYASFVQLGSPVAYLIPTVLFATLQAQMDEATFLAWGWRVPFLLSALVVVVGLDIRSKIDESETFKAAREHRNHESAPIKQLFANRKKEAIGGFLTKFAEAAVFPFYTVFLVAYANANHYNPTLVLEAVVFAILAEIIMIPIWGRITDKFGRKPVYMTLALLNLLLIVPAFLAVQSENLLLITLLLIVGLAFGHAGTYAPQASYFPELFDSSVRYTGVSFVWQFGAMVASGPFTVVATALLIFGGGHYLWAAIYTGFLVLCTIVGLRDAARDRPGQAGRQGVRRLADRAAAQGREGRRLIDPRKRPARINRSGSAVPDVRPTRHKPHSPPPPRRSPRAAPAG